jgi:hypothetical protein
MKNTELQQILVFKNETSKFVHVGVYNMYDKSGNSNYNCKLEYQYRDANNAKKKDEFIASIGAEKAFGSSFFVRLMNTPLDQWEVDAKLENLSVHDANVLSTKMLEDYEIEGYNVTGLRYSKIIRHDGTGKKSPNNIIIKNATMKRIHDIVEKLTEGMIGINLNKVKRDIYIKYIDPKTSGFDTRRKFWHHIIRNWDNYAS